jgi:hypothetical protein
MVNGTMPDARLGYVFRVFEAPLCLALWGPLCGPHKYYSQCHRTHRHGRPVPSLPPIALSTPLVAHVRQPRTRVVNPA